MSDKKYRKSERFDIYYLKQFLIFRNGILKNNSILLGNTKETALNRNLIPICSCDFDDFGLLKSINKNGFRNMNQMLLVRLDSKFPLLQNKT